MMPHPLTSFGTHHQDLMDHLLHGAQSLLPHVLAVGPPHGDDPSLAITFEVSPFLHDLTHLQVKSKQPFCSTVGPRQQFIDPANNGAQ